LGIESRKCKLNFNHKLEGWSKLWRNKFVKIKLKHKIFLVIRVFQKSLKV